MFWNSPLFWCDNKTSASMLMFMPFTVLTVNGRSLTKMLSSNRRKSPTVVVRILSWYFHSIFCHSYDMYRGKVSLFYKNLLNCIYCIVARIFPSISLNWRTLNHFTSSILSTGSFLYMTFSLSTFSSLTIYFNNLSTNILHTNLVNFDYQRLGECI